MTPALIGKAQRMYDANKSMMAEIAHSCDVTPMTIYYRVRTSPPKPEVLSARGSTKHSTR